MKAYAILDGGGVKGAALAGALRAAEEHGIRFEGFAGTSAGALVATLAAVGYTAQEIREIFTGKLRFTSFLDDDGTVLESAKRALSGLESPAWAYIKHRGLLRNLRANLGLYTGSPISKFILDSVVAKYADLAHRNDVTFQDLRDRGCRLLKIVTTDLGTRRALIYSAAGGHEISGSVCDAVRASTSYPFVFQPVKVSQRYLVDGGLCSNLPVFAFEREREVDRLPIIAFDLVQRPPDLGGECRINRFCADMIATALESPDNLVRAMVKGVHHVQIVVPERFGTLDFHLTPEQSDELFEIGYSAAQDYFVKRVPQWRQAQGRAEILQALTGVPQDLMTRTLRSLVADFESETPAKSVRANVMLPTAAATRVIVYQYGMNGDPDEDLELEIHSGCTGLAWQRKRPVAADLERARETFANEWAMTPAQQAMVRGDRRAMFGVPIFDLSDAEFQPVDDLPLLGTLAVDTSTPLQDTGWVGEHRAIAVKIATEWADIISRLLT